MLHTKLGKPIPPQEPEIIGGPRKSVSSTPKINFVQSGGLGISTGNGEPKEDEVEEAPEPDIQPVGQDYIEEIKSDDGKVIIRIIVQKFFCNLLPAVHLVLIFFCCRLLALIANCVNAVSMIQMQKKCT